MPRTGILISYNPALLIHAIFSIRQDLFFLRFGTSYQYGTINFKPPTPKLKIFFYFPQSFHLQFSCHVTVRKFFIKQ
jgi:hypothetical protein